MWGAYRGFLENGLQPDWVHIDDIAEYDLLYFPYPIMLKAAQAEIIAGWVERGGTLIAEACPGYFGDRGHVGTTQPNSGLDLVFGVREDTVEFMPDIGERIRFAFDGWPVNGGGLLQSYHLAGGTERGRFADGRVAVVEHRHGAGRTLLIGTNPSVGYYTASGDNNRRFFADVFAWSGKDRHVRLSNPALFARIHEGAEGSFLWLVNTTRKPQQTELSFGRGFAKARPNGRVWPQTDAVGGGTTFEVGSRDALILTLT
jgi:beta-galactosidase